MNPLIIPTAEEAEDAAARALARLIQEGFRRHRHLLPVCRELLRGPLIEDGSRLPAGYGMRSPIDPTLIEIGHIGARLVELSYTVPNVARALQEARDLVEPISGHSGVQDANTPGLRAPQTP
jgi:hypothetical protein